jgi:hypothetical protein
VKASSSESGGIDNDDDDDDDENENDTFVDDDGAVRCSGIARPLNFLKGMKRSSKPFIPPSWTSMFVVC